MTFEERTGVSEQLEKEIGRLLTKLEMLDPTSDEYDKCYKKVSELLKVRGDEMKLVEDNSRKIEELDLKEQELEQSMSQKAEELILKAKELEQREAEAKDRESTNKKNIWITIGSTLLTIAAPLIFNGVWYTKGMRFEETGSFTSTTFREIRNKNKK